MSAGIELHLGAEDTVRPGLAKRRPSTSNHAAVLTALKNKPCGRPLIKRPFLTALPRDSSAEAWAGTRGWRPEPNKRMVPWGPFCTPVQGHVWKPIDTLRRTKTTLIYRKTGNLRAVQLIRRWKAPEPDLV